MSQITKKIVCLANSRRNQERCIAGKELLEGGTIGGWVRPVSSRPSEEVSSQERQYEGGGEPQLLDIIDVPLLRANPMYYQQENWLLDSSQRWKKVGQMGSDALVKLVDPVDALWIDGESSGAGRNDRVPFSEAALLDSSLYLIQVSSLKVTVLPPNRDEGLPALRGHFRYNGTDYSLRITDPESESGAADLDPGDYEVGTRFLTVSLGGPFQSYSYKLIANIIRL